MRDFNFGLTVRVRAERMHSSSLAESENTILFGARFFLGGLGTTASSSSDTVDLNLEDRFFFAEL